MQSNKEKMMNKMAAKMPMLAEVGMSKPTKPTYYSFDVRVEKKKLDGSEGCHICISEMGMDGKKEEFTSVDKAMSKLGNMLNSKVKELGGKKQEMETKENGDTDEE